MALFLPFHCIAKRIWFSLLWSLICWILLHLLVREGFAIEHFSLIYLRNQNLWPMWIRFCRNMLSEGVLLVFVGGWLGECVVFYDYWIEYWWWEYFMFISMFYCWYCNLFIYYYRSGSRTGGPSAESMRIKCTKVSLYTYQTKVIVNIKGSKWAFRIFT